MIKIGRKKYTLKYNLRALMVYEELAGQSFEPGKLRNELILYYSIVIANNAGCELSFDSFIAELEKDNMKLLGEFREWIGRELGKVPVDDDEDKKKA